MKVESTRAGQHGRFQHAVGFFADDGDLVRQAAPLVRAALSRGEPVGLAMRPSTEQALLQAVGSPEGVISFAERDGAACVSGQTVAARRARELRALVGDAGTGTVLTEHTAQFDGREARFWTELDAALNIACADLPVSLTCFYPQSSTRQGLLAGARRNHPLLLVDGDLRHNPQHQPPHRVLADLPPARLPVLGPPHLRLQFRAWNLHEVRATLEQGLLDAGYARAQAEDVVLAVNEVATNAVEHGTLQAELLVWIGPDGVVCEVHDGGRLTDPVPGLRPPHPGERRGRGIWVARQLCDTLHVWSDVRGTHVRVHTER